MCSSRIRLPLWTRFPRSPLRHPLVAPVLFTIPKRVLIVRFCARVKCGFVLAFSVLTPLLPDGHNETKEFPFSFFSFLSTLAILRHSPASLSLRLAFSAFVYSLTLFRVPRFPFHEVKNTRYALSLFVSDPMVPSLFRTWYCPSSTRFNRKNSTKGSNTICRLGSYSVIFP